jgi:hypothetical protein
MTARRRTYVIAVVMLAATAWCAQPALATPRDAPTVLPEPAVTVGTTNTIRWTFPPNGWSTFAPHLRKDEGFLVTATDLTSRQVRAVSVSGGLLTSATVSGLINGRSYEYVVRARDRQCTTTFVFGCGDFGNLNAGPPSQPVTSAQDAAPPSGTFVIAGDAEFTNRLAVNVQLAAIDPGSAASGVGYVQFSRDGSFACPVQALTCASPYAPEMGVTLAPGADGPRTIFARFYDRARGPASSATPSAFERNPPGNRSAPTSDTILLDTIGPTLSVARSAEPAMMNVPVSFNASASRDQGGFGADSGLDAGTAVWDFGDGTSSSGLAVTHTYTRAGTFNASLSIRDRAGNESRLAFVVNVSPTAPGGSTTTTGTPTPNPPQADTTAPTLSGVRLVRRARIVFSLSEAATVFLEVRRLRPRPLITLFRVSRVTGAGSNVLSLTAKIRKRFARVGRYRIFIGARDAAGNPSRVTTLTIRGGKR